MVLVNTRNQGDAKSVCLHGHMQVQEGSAKNCLLSLTLDFTKKAGIYQSVLLIPFSPPPSPYRPLLHMRATLLFCCVLRHIEFNQDCLCG